MILFIKRLIFDHWIAVYYNSLAAPELEIDLDFPLNVLLIVTCLLGSLISLQSKYLNEP